MDKLKEAEEILDDKMCELNGKMPPKKEDEVKEMLLTIEKLVSEHAYHDHFRNMLKKHGVKSPAQIPPDKRGTFFKTVSATWKAKKKLHK
jgi:hypothetical protein